MKKSRLTASHHQVTCWNENPFFLHCCVDNRHFLCDISGGRRGGGSGRSSSYCRKPSLLYAINNYHCSPEMRKSPQRWVWREGMRVCCLPGPQTKYQHLLPPHWLDCTKSSLLPSDPTEKQPQTNRKGMKWCTRLYEDSRELLVRIHKWN